MATTHEEILCCGYCTFWCGRCTKKKEGKEQAPAQYANTTKSTVHITLEKEKKKW